MFLVFDSYREPSTFQPLLLKSDRGNIAKCHVSCRYLFTQIQSHVFFSIPKHTNFLTLSLCICCSCCLKKSLPWICAWPVPFHYSDSSSNVSSSKRTSWVPLLWHTFLLASVQSPHSRFPLFCIPVPLFIVRSFCFIW